MDLNDSLQSFPGIGPTRAKALARLGLTTARDLMGYFPRAYEDRTKYYSIRQAPSDLPVCVTALVASPPRLSRIRRGLELVKLRAADQSGLLDVTFFNQAYVKNQLLLGKEYVFFGKVEGTGSRRQMTNPTFEPVENTHQTGCIFPIYSLTAGVSNNLLARLSQRIAPVLAPQMEEILPQDVLEAHDLLSAPRAYAAIHWPPTVCELSQARRRFVFQELFLLTAGLSLLKNRRFSAPAPVIKTREPLEFEGLLPFALTDAQRRVIAQCAADMASGKPMNRLVQGDVGSGKTVVAAACAYLAHRSGYQSAMMAPTEILAQQHFRTLTDLLSPAHMTVGLLTGSMKAAEKKSVLAALKNGDIHFLVGTHALLSQGVEFQNLALVITDEQHRFGVNQRSALAAKAEQGGEGHAHTLVMSATPIPRTLALIIYGDLDLSVIDQLPPGRLPVKTHLVGESKRQGLYGFIRDQVREGRQVYMVCPAISPNEEGDWTEGLDLKYVNDYAQTLQTKVFPDLRVGLVHGKLKPKEKEAVMAAFAGGALDILVSTTVIEVGVDVPNASLIVIENAERYGLSQLHQLRGRVGRGKHQSWCMLLSGSTSPETRKRLKVLTDTADGFVVAQADLDLRGPGDFFGARQHGLPALHLASLGGDTRVLQEAQDAAQALLEGDPKLTKPEHGKLLARVKSLFAENPDIFN